MLPLIKDRPISMKRYPQGIKKEGFFQKNAPQGLPKWVKTVSVSRKENGAIDMILCNDKKTLNWLVNQNCITPHIWLSKYDKPNLPDRLIFDLDPPKGKGFDLVVKAGFALKELLEKTYKLSPFVMTTGSRGLHIVVPIKRKHSFHKVRAFAKQVATALCEQDPKTYTLEPRKNKRKGRLYVDVLRNGKKQTGVAPYSVRSKDGAPVATPLSWSELKKKGIRSDSFTIKNFSSRLKKNPWTRIDRKAKTLAL